MNGRPAPGPITGLGLVVARCSPGCVKGRDMRLFDVLGRALGLAADQGPGAARDGRDGGRGRRRRQGMHCKPPAELLEGRIMLSVARAAETAAADLAAPVLAAVAVRPAADLATQAPQPVQLR